MLLSTSRGQNQNAVWSSHEIVASMPVARKGFVVDSVVAASIHVQDQTLHDFPVVSFVQFVAQCARGELTLRLGAHTLQCPQTETDQRHSTFAHRLAAQKTKRGRQSCQEWPRHQIGVSVCLGFRSASSVAVPQVSWTNCTRCHFRPICRRWRREWK